MTEAGAPGSALPAIRGPGAAQAVVDGLMRAGLDTCIPVLSVSLTPHQYQETEHHNAIYRDHFVQKGREAAQAALQITKTRAGLAVAA